MVKYSVVEPKFLNHKGELCRDNSVKKLKVDFTCDIPL